LRTQRRREFLESSPEQLRVRLANGFPECAIRRLEHFGAPDRNSKAAGWPNKAPQPSDCSLYIWNKENAEDAYRSIERSVSIHPIEPEHYLRNRPIEAEQIFDYGRPANFVPNERIDNISSGT
jgi:hypothetical protein